LETVGRYDTDRGMINREIELTDRQTHVEPNTWNLFQMLYKKGTRKFLQTLQPSGVDKENLVGTGRFREHRYEFIFRFIVY